jgi:hypothetical protein
MTTGIIYETHSTTIDNERGIATPSPQRYEGESRVRRAAPSRRLLPGHVWFVVVLGVLYG